MTCETCPLIVKRTLAKVDGVRKVDDGKVTVTSLIDATTGAGYPARLTKSAGR